MDIEILERLPHESTREYAYRCLKVNIINLRLEPGSALSEKDISVLLNVSRTPVREAFIQLSKEYLLDILPQKGTYISLIDIENVQESVFLREVVEREVICLACNDFPQSKIFELQSCLALQELSISEKNYEKFFELDEKMHRDIFEGCKKARIWSLIQQVSTHYNRVRMLNLSGKYGSTNWNKLLKQHQQIITAIREKNVELGSDTINLHLNKIKFDIEELVVDFPSYFKQKQANFTRI